MKMIPQIFVKTDGVNAELLIDGKPLKCVRAIRFEHEAGSPPVLSIDFSAADIYLDGKFVPALPEPYGQWYKRKKPEDEEEA